jgi:hypothetical protein
MSLARVWRRQLYGASSAALIVPSAMLAALLVLALGGGFSQVGVLGQIFAGPPAPSPGALPGGGGGGGRGAPAVGNSIPVIPLFAAVRTRPPAGRVVGSGGRGGAVRAPSAGSTRTGGALAPVGGVAPIVTGRGGGSTPKPAAPSEPVAQPSPAPHPSPAPQPGPRRQPTPVDTVVTVVTSVTQQVPAPVGPAATQAVQSAGSTADNVLPPPPTPPPVPQGLKIP